MSPHGTSDEDRLTRLEELTFFQEERIEKLDAALMAQQNQLDAVEQELASDFAPLELQLLRRDQAGLSDEEQARLAQGLYAVRIAEWGYYETVLAPLDKQWLVRLHAPPDPLDINVLSWGVTVLIGAAMLGCAAAVAAGVSSVASWADRADTGLGASSGCRAHCRAS